MDSVTTQWTMILMWCYWRDVITLLLMVMCVCVCVVPSDCINTAEVVFVVATSGSLDPYYMPRIKEFLVNMTESLPVDIGRVRIAVITYAADVRLEIALGQFGTNVKNIIAAINNIHYHGTRSVFYYQGCSPRGICLGSRRPRGSLFLAGSASPRPHTVLPRSWLGLVFDILFYDTSL